MKTTILDGLANEYIRKCLLQGSIMAEKAKSIDLGGGVTSAYLPDRAVEKIPPFNIGGLFDTEEAREAEEKVAGEIIEYLMNGTNRCEVASLPSHFCTEIPGSLYACISRC